MRDEGSTAAVEVAVAVVMECMAPATSLTAVLASVTVVERQEKTESPAGCRRDASVGSAYGGCVPARYSGSRTALTAYVCP